jgi:hypothetical protein
MAAQFRFALQRTCIAYDRTDYLNSFSFFGIAVGDAAGECNRSVSILWQKWVGYRLLTTIQAPW